MPNIETKYTYRNLEEETQRKNWVKMKGNTQGRVAQGV